MNDDVNGVREWCRCSEGDVNRRDHCGRAPLHVAASCANSVEIVQLLIDKGARLIARLQDGRTALHIAAGRGKNDFVQAILRRSELNEEEKMAREDRKRLAKKAEKSAELPEENEKEVEIDGSDDESDLNEFAESGSYNGDATSATQSFVKIKPQKNETEDIYADIDVEDDVLDVNVTSWDFRYECTQVVTRE